MALASARILATPIASDGGLRDMTLVNLWSLSSAGLGCISGVVTELLAYMVEVLVQPLLVFSRRQ